MSLHLYQDTASAEPIQQRLSDMATGSGTAAKAGALLGRLGAPPPLAEAAMARIEGTLMSAAPASAATAAVLRWLGIGITVAAVSGTTYFATTRPVKRGQPAVQLLSAPSTTSIPKADSAATGALLQSDVTVAEAQDEPAPAALRPSNSSRSVRIRKSVTASATAAPSPPIAPPPVEESGLLVESQMLGQALHQLHQSHDANAALSSLTAYEARFPHGLLGEEAQAAKVDALLALSRRGEALTLLDRVTFSRLARGGELRAVRGELRATASRCAEAVSDFGWALGHQPTVGTAERALYGRAACKQTLHDTGGARADYSEYLQRFPTGKFAAAVNAALRELPEK